MSKAAQGSVCDPIRAVQAWKLEDIMIYLDIQNLFHGFPAGKQNI